MFGIDDIAGNDKLVSLYTGFPSYDILLAFFEFLGPAVANLNYWGEKERERRRHCQRKLDLVDQFLLTSWILLSALVFLSRVSYEGGGGAGISPQKS